MKKLLKYTACLAILLMVVVLFTGCKVTGGGWFMDTDRKCTFGLNAQGTKIGEGLLDWEYKGQFQFNDHAGCKIHVEVMQMTAWEDEYAEFSGMTDDGKVVVVGVTDQGEPGADAGDGIIIWIDTPFWMPPTYAGELGGGNIQIH